MDSIASFKKAYEQWQNSLAATFAVGGEKGSGKSTFLNLTIDAELNGEPVHHIDMQSTIWTEGQLVELLASELEIIAGDNIDDLIGIAVGFAAQGILKIYSEDL